MITNKLYHRLDSPLKVLINVCGVIIFPSTCSLNISCGILPPKIFSNFVMKIALGCCILMSFSPHNSCMVFKALLSRCSKSASAPPIFPNLLIWLLGSFPCFSCEAPCFCYPTCADQSNLLLTVWGVLSSEFPVFTIALAAIVWYYS